MRVYCKGFNLYNQLNDGEKCLAEFQKSIETSSIDHYEIRYSFSILFSDNKLKLIGQYENNNLNNCENLNVKEISSNDKIILILSDAGTLQKISIDNLSSIELLPKIVENEDRIKHICCGSKLTVAYTEKGFLYNIPEKLEFNNLDIVDIKTGQEHCILLDKLGNIYTFGRGSRGQLGHGQLDDEFNPKLVDALAGIKIVAVAAGGWHSAAVSQEGDLYTWGWHGNGQLGLSKDIQEKKEKNVSVMATPHVIDIKDCSENRVVQIACGRKHTIVLLDNNSIYGCGWNKYKQIKNDEVENYLSFTLIIFFSHERVEKIVCGPWNTAVICK